MPKYYKLNEKIRADKVRVITRNGENLGVLSRQEALEKARERGLDLVLIAEEAKPPVAKILDFNKFLYEENKKAQQARAGSKRSELKEFRFGPTIEEGDLNTRIRRSKEFIKGGDKVKITIRLRGRENAYPELAFEKIKKMEEGLADVARLEKKPEKKGSLVTASFVKK